MTQEVKLKRAKCNYQNENARFLLECDFSKQYNHYYQRRLQKTRPLLEYNCRNKWDPDIPLYDLAKLAEVIGSDGGDFDRMELSPSNSPESDPIGSYKFSKRQRKFSEGFSPVPKTSTQLDQNVGVSPISPSNICKSPGGTMETPILAAHQINPTKSRQCIIIGTIFKRMKLQPDVVEELSKGDFHVKVDRYLGHYTSQDDKLVLEDVDETISLVGNIDPKKYVTGIVAAILGMPIDEGSQFLVDDVCFAEPNPLILYDEETINSVIERPLSVNGKPIYLLVVSGLGFSQDMDMNSAITRSLQNLIDFIWGGGNYEDDERSSQIARVLVVGDNLSQDRLISPEGLSQSEAQKDDIAAKMKKSRQVKSYNSSIQAVKHMDDFFSQLSKTINVDVMPGASDPSSHMMPQQPFHPCMFPKSCMFSTFNCTTNPHHAIYNENVEIIATAGQNIDIISKFSNLADPIDIMKCHLKWGNLAPSAPDNLYSAPYEDEDPYVIDFIPEIYIAGCQKSYRTEKYPYPDYNEFDTDNTLSQNSPNPGNSSKADHIRSQKPISRFSSQSGIKSPVVNQKRGIAQSSMVGNKRSTLLVTVPRFCESFSCVLIDLYSLETQLISLV